MDTEPKSAISNLQSAILAKLANLTDSAPVLASVDFCTAGAAGEFGGILLSRSRAAAVDAD